MLQPCSNKTLLTAATIPGQSRPTADKAILRAITTSKFWPSFCLRRAISSALGCLLLAGPAGAEEKEVGATVHPLQTPSPISLDSARLVVDGSDTTRQDCMGLDWTLNLSNPTESVLEGRYMLVTTDNDARVHWNEADQSLERLMVPFPNAADPDKGMVRVSLFRGILLEKEKGKAHCQFHQKIRYFTFPEGQGFQLQLRLPTRAAWHKLGPQELEVRPPAGFSFFCPQRPQLKGDGVVNTTLEAAGGESEIQLNFVRQRPSVWSDLRRLVLASTLAGLFLSLPIAFWFGRPLAGLVAGAGVSLAAFVGERWLPGVLAWTPASQEWQKVYLVLGHLASPLCAAVSVWLLYPWLQKGRSDKEKGETSAP